MILFSVNIWHRNKVQHLFNTVIYKVFLKKPWVSRTELVSEGLVMRKKGQRGVLFTRHSLEKTPGTPYGCCHNMKPWYM